MVILGLHLPHQIGKVCHAEPVPERWGWITLGGNEVWLSVLHLKMRTSKSKLWQTVSIPWTDNGHGKLYSGITYLFGDVNFGHHFFEPSLKGWIGLSTRREFQSIGSFPSLSSSTELNEEPPSHLLIRSGSRTEWRNDYSHQPPRLWKTPEQLVGAYLQPPTHLLLQGTRPKSHSLERWGDVKSQDK